MITSACPHAFSICASGTGCAPAACAMCIWFSLRAQTMTNIPSAQSRAVISRPIAPVARHQRRLAHQRPLFDPHHRCQRALGRQPRVLAQKWLVFSGRTTSAVCASSSSFTSPPASTARQAESARARFPRPAALRRNQFLLPKALRPRQHHRLRRRHFRHRPPRPRCAASPSPRARRPQHPAHSFVPAKGNQSHVHPSRRWYAARRRFMAKNKNCRTSLKLNSNVTFQSFIPASTCSAGSGSRRPRFRSCRTGRCAWASPARVPASCRPCSSHG